MNRVFSAAKLDFYASKAMLRTVAFLVLLGVVIGLATHGPTYTMMFMMVFGVTSSGSVFSIHEKSHSDKLYGILPLKKTEIILGRYLYALLIGAAYVVTGAALGAVMSVLMLGKIDPVSYWATLAVAFVYFGFATGIAYPLYFKFSFAKAYIFTMIPMYVILVLILVLMRKANFAGGLTALVQLFTAHVALLTALGLLDGLILLTVSALISNLIYTKKEI